MADLNNLLAELDYDDAEVVVPRQEEEEEDNNNNINEEEGFVRHDERRDSRTTTTTTMVMEQQEYPEIPEVLAQAQADRNHNKNNIPYNNNNDDDNDNDGNKYNAMKNDDEVDTDGLNFIFHDGPASEPDEDYIKMKHLWVQEMLSPELLPYDTETISLELELLEGQEETIDKLFLLGNHTARSEPQTSHSSSSSSSHQMTALMAQIYKMDVERTKYVVSDLLATRLGKLEEYALYNRDYVNRMSEDEVSYLKSYGELLEKHFRRTVLDQMPKDAWKKLDEPDMIPSPDMDSFVFIQVMEDMVEIGEEPFGIGSCLIARYGTVQSLLLERKIELLM